jgi:hypothetical protein
MVGDVSLLSQGIAVTAFSSFGAPSYMELDMASAQESCLQVLPSSSSSSLALSRLAAVFLSLSPLPISLHRRRRCTLTSSCARVVHRILVEWRLRLHPHF